MFSNPMARRRVTFPVLAIGAALVAAIAVVPTAADRAQAEVPLNCGSNDQRTASDKLPKPGVIVVDDSFGVRSYEAYTVGEEGNLDEIFIDNEDYTIPVVAAWQNGTACSGSEMSRNAWGVGPTGRVWGNADFSGPAAANYGDASGLPLNKPIVGMSPTSTGRGYWLVASDGGIFTYGDSRFFGSTGNIRLNQPIVGMSVTRGGNGYWMVASDGGIFSFGDAPFYGSTGNIRLNRPISAMITTPSGNGYWMVASDGGIFTFGDAPFYGSAGSYHLNAPISGMVPNDLGGYTLIGQDGALYPFGPQNG